MGASVRWNEQRGKWTVYVSRNGKRKAITCEDRAEAEAVAKKIRGEHEAASSWLDGLSTLAGPACQGWLETYRPTRRGEVMDIAIKLTMSVFVVSGMATLLMIVWDLR